MALNQILNNQFEPQYRDQWGRQQPVALERARSVLESQCHVIRYYQVPDDRQAQFAAAGDYRQTTLALAPGSFILGFMQQSAGGATCLLQLTDVETQHKLFAQPYPSQQLFRGGAWYFPCPMPVIAPGIILVEIYAQSSGECSVVLVVADLDRQRAVDMGCLNV